MSHPSRLPPDFAYSAAYPLFAIDPRDDMGCVLEFTREQYRHAAFLDGRALAGRQAQGWELTRGELESALPSATDRPRVHWLFHAGHCGSTLVSRLLDLLPEALGLREPLPLLAIAQARGEAAVRPWTPLVLRLLERRFRPGQQVIVKPTSLVSVLALELLVATQGNACLLWIDLETWLATLLRDPGIVASMLDTERARIVDLAAWPDASGPGQRLARAWLDQQWQWSRLSLEPAFSGRLAAVDFADVLQDPAAGTTGLARHYGLDVPAGWPDTIAASGLLGRYAKDDRQAFGAQARQAEISAALAQHRDEVDAGIAWATRALAQRADAGLLPRLRPP